jgi:hypothetical protein
MNTRTKRAVSKIETEVEAVETEVKDVKADIKAKFEEVVEQAKTRSQENRLMMLGLIANARKARDERKASLIEAGRAFEPELQAKIDELKSKFKIGEGKDAKDEDGEPSKLQERMASGFESLGLATRKDLNELSKKVDKLIDLQRA